MIYGYARVSQGMKDDWQKNLEQYLLKREQIVKLVQFVDARHEIQKNHLREILKALSSFLQTSHLFQNIFL